VITIDLTIQQVDTAVTQDEAVLTAVLDGATYQWIDCDNGNQPLEGETDQQFTATASGNYAVIVSEGGGCADTSSCYSVTVVRTEDILTFTDLNLFPNPAHEHL
jgi:hypothetical protein